MSATETNSRSSPSAKRNSTVSRTFERMIDALREANLPE
jgi:hypothetical protein